MLDGDDDGAAADDDGDGDDDRDDDGHANDDDGDDDDVSVRTAQRWKARYNTSSGSPDESVRTGQWFAQHFGG